MSRSFNVLSTAGLVFIIALSFICECARTPYYLTHGYKVFMIPLQVWVQVGMNYSSLLTRYEYKLTREYNWNVKNKASKGYEVRHLCSHIYIHSSRACDSASPTLE